jgi:hypothetical protein
VALPVAPQSYSLPAGALVVSTSQQLVSALASRTTQDIVLANGTYTTAGTNSATPFFQVSNGDRLWAREPGRAVLQSGLTFGGNYGHAGGELHGLAFDVTDSSLTESSAAISSWGADGVGTKIYDTTIDGHYALSTGIDLYQGQDAVVQRVVAQHFLDYGVRISNNASGATPEVASTVTDIYVDGVREATPGSTNGTAEFGIWIGDPVTNPVARLRSEHGWFGGLWTGAASRGTTFQDITVETVDSPTGVAIYSEHYTIGDTFQRFNLGPHIDTGFNCEWNHGSGWGACQHTTFEHGTINSRTAGVFLDQGQFSNTVRAITFRGQSCAAIVDNHGTANIYRDNNVTAIAPGAVATANHCR